MMGAALLMLAVTAAEPIRPVEWISPEDYPSPALREKRAGTSSFMLFVSAEGVPVGCGITQSSGHKDLDDQTCAALLTRAHLAPARDAAGNAMPAIYRNRSRWWTGDGRPPLNLPPGPVDVEVTIQAMPGKVMSPARIDVAFAVDAKGLMSDCTPIPPQPSAEPASSEGQQQRLAVRTLGAVACQQAMASLKPPIFKDAKGEPAASIQTAQLRFSVEGETR